MFAAGWICFCSTFKPLQGTEQCTPCGPCEEGFTRVGCGGKSPGQCTGITCSAAPSVLHAVVQVSNSGVFPSSATYTCAAGYELASGSNNRLTCNTDGGWDGSIPQCVGVPCPQLTIDAGTVKPSTQVRYPDTATFSCSPGFVLQGQSTLQCRADKTWSDSVPTCIGRPCTALEAPGDGEVNFSNNGRYPSTATYTCSSGYELHGGDETRECMAGTGTFDGTAPTCRGVQCDDLPGPDNGQVRLSATPARYPATAEFFCSPGYELVGDVAASCQTDGTWSNAAPVCRGVSCTAPTIANAAVDATSERFPAEATVTCAEGFGLVGTSTITCGVDGTWATLPSCVECAINTFAESPTQPCQPCPSGTSTNNEKGASSCECLPGHEPSAAADDDGVCVPCSDNFFKADWGNGNCEACQDGYVTENGDFTTCVGTLCQALPEVWCRVCVYVCACVCVCVCAASFSNSQVLCLFKRAFSLSLSSQIDNGAPSTVAVFRFPSTVQYECDSGFKVAQGSPSSVQCQPTGSWTAAPVCVNDCGDGMSWWRDAQTQTQTKGTLTPSLLHSFAPSLLHSLACISLSGVVVDGEECDDGNDEDGDGCSSTCQIEGTHACTDEGDACTYCNFTTRPEPLQLSCADADLSTKIASWASVAGNADTIDHVHCGDRTLSYEVASTTGTVPSCYRQRYAFTVKFNGDLVQETISGTVTVTDKEAPDFSFTPQPTVSASCEAVPAFANVTAADNCMASAPPVSKKEEREDGRCAFAYTLTRSWATEDECGNTNAMTQTVMVDDATEPAFDTTSLDRNLECKADPEKDIDALLGSHLGASATDNCATSLSFTAEATETKLDECGGTGTVSVLVTATDTCDNTKEQPATITVADNVPPAPVNVPGDASVECNAVPPMPDDVYAVDACRSVRVDAVTGEERTDGTCPHTYTLHRSFAFEDACKHGISKTQVIKVQDTNAPVITVAAQDLELECNGESNDAAIQAWLAANAGANAADACSSADQLRWSNDFDQSFFDTLPGGCSAGTGEVNVTFTVTDECGRSTPTTARILVEDNHAPAFTSTHPSLTVACDEVPEPAGATAMDNCTGAVTPTVTTARTDGECPHRYSLVYTWTATDECGKSAAQQQTLTVTDMHAPSISVPATDQTAECDASTNAQTLQSFLDAKAGAKAKETCGAVQWLHADASAVEFDVAQGVSGTVQQQAGCGNTFTASATFYAVDECSNANSTTATLTVQDTQDPEFDDPPAMTIDASCASVPVLANITATDACEGALVGVASEQRLDGRCAHAYTLSRTWVAHDGCGHVVSTPQLVRVHDDSAPSIGVQAADLIVECDGDTDAAIATWLAANGRAAASDDCSSALTWQHDYEQVKTQLQYGCGANEVTVTFTVFDECGNHNSTRARVVVQDTVPPVIMSVPANISKECNPAVNRDQLNSYIQANGFAMVHDVCTEAIVGRDVTWTHEIERTDTCGVAFESIVRFTATDACGNGMPMVGVVSFQDTQEPEIILKGADPQLAQVNFPWTDPSVEVAADVCHPELDADHVTVINPPNTTLPGAYNVTYQAEDACGIIGTATRTVFVRDTIAPAISVLGERRMYVAANAEYVDPGAEARDASSPAQAVLLSARAYADGGVQLPTVRGAATSDSNRTSFQVVYEAADAAGNHAFKLARVVNVLYPPLHTPPMASVTVAFDRSVSVSASESSTAPAYTCVRFVTSADVSSAADVVESQLAQLLGGEVYTAQVVDAAAVQKEVMVVLGAVPPSVLRRAMAFPQFDALTPGAGVVAFHGSLRLQPPQCGDIDGVRDTLARTGRGLQTAACDGCLCVFASQDPPLNPTLPKATFDAMHLEQRLQTHVTVASTQPSSSSSSSSAAVLSLSALRLRLQQVGVVPTRLVYPDPADQSRASFVTRTALPDSATMAGVVKATVESTRTVVATRIRATVLTSVSEVVMRAQFYTLGIVPSLFSLGTWARAFFLLFLRRGRGRECVCTCVVLQWQSFLCLSASASASVSVCLSVSACLCLSLSLSVSPSLSLCLCLSVCLSLCVGRSPTACATCLLVDCCFFQMQG